MRTDCMLVSQTGEKVRKSTERWWWTGLIWKWWTDEKWQKSTDWLKECSRDWHRRETGNQQESIRKKKKKKKLWTSGKHRSGQDVEVFRLIHVLFSLVVWGVEERVMLNWEWHFQPVDEARGVWAALSHRGCSSTFWVCRQIQNSVTGCNRQLPLAYDQGSDTWKHTIK